jgi:hypothetical protein
MTKQQLPNLSQFQGSEVFLRHLTGAVYTEGVRFVAQTCGAFWLIDEVLFGQMDRRIRRNPKLREIQFWTLRVKDGSAVLTCREDDGIPPAYTKQIPYTDFPEGDFDLWFENRTLHLPQER